MQLTRNQYARAGWPPPALLIEVDSPLAGMLLLAKIYQRAEQAANSNWGRVWEVFWDSLPIEIRKFAPKITTPNVGAGGLQGLPNSSIQPQSSFEWERNQNLVDFIVEQQVLADLRQDNYLAGDGLRLWQTIQQRLTPTIKDNGTWLWSYTGIGVQTKPPAAVPVDARNRVHREDGSAVEYGDGWGPFLWHGTIVPRNAVMTPTTITVQQIEAERNAEVKRVLIERMGPAKYVELSGAVEVSRDRFGILLRKEVAGEEPIVVVRVINSTPEPDGQFKIYWLRVPPNIQTAKGGIAWSFGMLESEYDPEEET